MHQYQFSRLLGILLLLTAPSRAEWVWRNPSTTTNTFSALSQGSGRYVAVGKAGTVAVSTDGRTWEAVSTGLTVDLHDVAYGDGKFVAAGSHGTLAWSPDGRRWQWGGEPGAAFDYRSVAWNGARFIAVSDSQGVPAAWSGNGATWNRGGLEGGGHLRIACTERLCMAGGLPGRISVTSDGIAWEARTPPQPDLSYRVDRIGPGFAVYSSNSLFRTEDGKSWTPAAPTPNGRINRVAPYRGGLIVASTLITPDALRSEGKIWTQDVGGAWKEVWVAFRNGLEAILSDGERVLAAGGGGTILSAEGDARFAIAGHRLIGENLTALAGSGSRLVAVGTHRSLLFGTNDSTWTSVTSLAPDRTGDFGDVAWSGSRFVAVGTSGIATSANGLEWIWTKAVTEYGFKRVIWTGERFIAMGARGDAWVSEEGMEWLRQGSPLPAHLAWGLLAWTGTEAIIAREDSLFASRDGLVWELRASHGLGQPIQIAGSKGILLARSGHLTRSADGGRTWGKVDIAGYPPPLRVLSLASGFAVVTRGAGGVGALTLHLSADGLAWSRVDLPLEHPPNGILEDRGNLILVGDGGAVLSASKADLPFSVGIRKVTSKKALTRPSASGNSRLPWRGREFDAAGRTRPAFPR